MLNLQKQARQCLLILRSYIQSDRHIFLSVLLFYQRIPVFIIIGQDFISTCKQTFQKLITKVIDFQFTHFCHYKIIQELYKLYILVRRMSHVIYGENKIICHFYLSQQSLTEKDQFLQINQLVLSIHHFQYPCVHYKKIFNHFRNLIPEKSTYLQIRLFQNSQQIPSDLPIGLFVQNEGRIKVTLNQFEISDPYKIIKQAWKQAFSAVNPDKGSYYINRQLGPQQLRSRIQKYFNGQSHNFQNQQYKGYEGTNIACRFMIQGQIVERKSDANQSKLIKDLILQVFPQLKQRKYSVKSHGLAFDLQMSTKQFLDQWSYNDGFCYLKIDLID